jgi:aquaporin Z
MTRTVQPLPRKLLAEFIGTFALVFVGTGAIVVDELSAGGVSPVGVALAFGLVIMVMIYAVGDTSGAHFNPAVSIGFWRARRLPAREVAPYALAQLGGAILASATLRVLFLEHPSLGATVPGESLLQSFVLELVITFLLMFVILAVALGRDDVRPLAGLAIGATVCLAAIFAGPICGASMNPARTLGPAIVSGTYTALWLYLSAPVAGALLAVEACRGVRGPGCCDAGD